MHIEQLYTNCLAEAAYYIESNGEAAIIDPLRETDDYLEKLSERGTQLKYIFETHFHADFVSGHLSLAEKTGAPIVFGPTAQPAFDAFIAKDNEVFRVGDIKIKVLHTPGHTMESSTFLMLDEHDRPHAIFTGDTLFIGDVGRPDLAVKSDLSKEDLAGHLYESLHQKIMPLPNDVIVYPGHGAGSACGKNMSEDTFDTLGHQKEFNYALQDMSKEEFVKQVTEGLTEPPQYFPKNAVLNKSGYENIDEVLKRGVKPLQMNAFDLEVDNGAITLDVRNFEEFKEGFIPNAINIDLEGMYAVWVGTLVEDLQHPIVVIAPEGREREAIVRLARVGYDNVRGYLDGGFKSWKQAGREIDTIGSISVDALADKKLGTEEQIVDVRKPDEYTSQHLENVENIPLDYIYDNLYKFDPAKTYYLHCKTGYRAICFASILKQQGINNVVNITGGFDEILESGKLKVTDYICPTTVEA